MLLSVPIGRRVLVDSAKSAVDSTMTMSSQGVVDRYYRATASVNYFRCFCKLGVSLLIET